MGGIPIVSLDKIYLSTDGNNIIFLDCTRLDGSKKLVSRNNSNSFSDVDEQIKKISMFLLDRGLKDIVLSDDVVFSGNVLRTITQIFNMNKINVIGIRSGISTLESYKQFNDELPLGLKCGYLLENKVIDQICERDFYFGIAQSGISVKVQDGLIYKSPYFKPYGNSIERASVPKDFEKEFSIGCINRNIDLWQELERLSGRTFYIKDLPEKIIETDEEEQIIKELKKGLRRI